MARASVASLPTNGGTRPRAHNGQLPLDVSPNSLGLDPKRDHHPYCFVKAKVEPIKVGTLDQTNLPVILWLLSSSSQRPASAQFAGDPFTACVLTVTRVELALP